MGTVEYKNNLLHYDKNKLTNDNYKNIIKVTGRENRNLQIGIRKEKPMKKWKKSFTIVTILILAGVVLKLCTNPEIRIKNFVSKHESDLQEIAVDYLSGEKYILLGQEESYKGVKIEGLQDGEHPIVKFFYSGKGIVPSGVYYGFYYSPDDMPVPVMDGDRLLTSVSEDEWEWTGIGDNGGRTKRIKPNWFYYEAWF